MDDICIEEAPLVTIGEENNDLVEEIIKNLEIDSSLKYSMKHHNSEDYIDDDLDIKPDIRMHLVDIDIHHPECKPYPVQALFQDPVYHNFNNVDFGSFDCNSNVGIKIEPFVEEEVETSTVDDIIIEKAADVFNKNGVDCGVGDGNAVLEFNDRGTQILENLKSQFFVPNNIIAPDNGPSPPDEILVSDKNLYDYSKYYKKFQSKSRLSCDMDRIHKNRKNFSCSYCYKIFIYKAHLIIHERSHTKEKLFPCEICWKSFSQKAHLKTHMRTHLGEKPFCCKICEKNFTTRGNLENHIRIHTGERPFICEYCSKNFRHLTVLRHHIRLHTGEKRYLCKFCKKSFIQQSGLNAHVRIHTGQKPYECDICNKRFSQRGNLQDHQTVHLVENPKFNSCEICGKNFSKKRNLMRHYVLLHTSGVKENFQCFECGKSFNQKSNLAVHLKSHMKRGKNFVLECEICLKTFSSQIKFDKHQNECYESKITEFEISDDE